MITCTGGEEGEIHDPDLVFEDAFPRLGEIRERELRAACAVLGVAELHLLGYRDSGMAGTSANDHPHAFANADLDEAATRVAALIRALRPRAIVTDNEHGGYGHPDHVMCHRVTVRAWGLAADPATPLAGKPWQMARLYVTAMVPNGWEEVLQLMRAEGLDTSQLEEILEWRRENVPPTPPDVIHAAIDVADYVEARRQALLCHRTQVPADSFFVNLPTRIARRAYATTYLRRLRPEPLDGERDDDFFPS